MMRRLTTLLIVVVLVLAAVLLTDRPNIEPDSEQTLNKTTPGAIVTRAVTRQYDATGKLQYRLEVERAEQFYRFNRQDRPLAQNRGYTDLTQPKLTLYSDVEDSDWHFRANFGRTENDGNLIRLWGNVVANRPLAGGGEYRLKTSELVVKPAQQLASTKRAVNIRSPEGTTQAVGMIINLPAETVTLESQVNGVYEPK